MNAPLLLPLWADVIPNHQEIGEENVEILRDGLEIYTQVSKPEISVFLPSKRNATGQAVVIIPGGGYEVVVHDWEGSDIAKWLNSHGIAGIVLKYRLPYCKSNIRRDKSPLLDAARAMRVVRYHAEKWGIDKNNIGVMGFSAGGHIASTLGTHFDENSAETMDSIDSISARPDFMTLVYPVITMSAPYVHVGSRDNFFGKNRSTELVDFYSNEKHVTNNTPPTILFHSSNDKVVSVENSLAFYQALIHKNVEAEIHVFQDGEHGFSLANTDKRLKKWKSMCLDWFDAINETKNV